MANKPTILRAAGNNINQALNGAINSSTTTVILDDAGDCNASGGLLEIDYNSPTLREVIYYNSKSTHTLTVADDGRGLYGTTAQSHLDGALVRGFFVDDHINKLVDVVSNIEVSDLAAAAVVTETDTIAANDNDTTLPTSAAVKAYADSLILSVYPVGAIYISVVSTSPATLFGGTWSAFGAGKVLVGIDAGDAAFDTVEETGGVKEVTLTSAQSGLPAHNHAGPGNIRRFQVSGGTAWVSDGVANSAVESWNVANNTAANAASAHTNLQPYIVVYMWKRTA